MSDVDIFLEVFQDVRFPFFAVDLSKLRTSLSESARTGLKSNFAVTIDVPSGKRAPFISSIRGLLRQIDVPPQMIVLFARSAYIQQSGHAQQLVTLAANAGYYGIAEVGDHLVWEEDSPWPVAYSTFLEQVLNVFSLHKAIIERKVSETAKLLKVEGFAPENVDTLSEYPRQLPTHIHYAAASLGAWVGGAMNVQYFGYYAAIRQIYHSALNLKYARRIGFSADIAEKLDASGIIALPASLVLPLLKAQGTNVVFGSISIDETNIANQPDSSFTDTTDINDSKALPGFVLDKYYRAPFRARQPGSYGFYGTQDLLRDHYTEFYDGLTNASLIRCKHFCVPVVSVSSIDELRAHISAIPNRHSEGMFFRGQRCLYLLQRDPEVREMLFGNSCSVEPSLITSASRHLTYDYDIVHFALKQFLEQKILIRDEIAGSNLYQEWQSRSTSPDCRLDSAILALAQHYGLPSHGLDVTDSVDVALWFATNVFGQDPDARVSSYKRIRADEWRQDRTQWPVVIACQCITHSIQQSLHDCEELADFGFGARRPNVQKARFFQGGHSDHQNRLAEAVVCVFRLAPGDYNTECSFEPLFPAPGEDPAYRTMLEFADSEEFSPIWGRFINRFHPNDNSA